MSGQGWWPIVETSGADGAGLEEVHGGASPSNCCCCSSITLPLEEMAHDVVAVGKEGSCWMRCRWSWWSGLLVGNKGGSDKEVYAGVLFSSGSGTEVAEVLGCCWSWCCQREKLWRKTVYQRCCWCKLLNVASMDTLRVNG